MEITSIASNLKEENGIWVGKGAEKVSYPDEGHQLLREIEEDSFWFNHRNDVIERVVNQFHSGEKVFFDIGGGNGFVSARLAEAGYETVLVEPGLDGVLNAKTRGVKHLINASFHEAVFVKESMPNVGLFDVVEHIDDDVAFLKEIHTALRPNGRVFVTVPAFNFLWSQNDEWTGHFRRYSVSQFTKTAHVSGFRVLYATYFFMSLPPGIFLLRSLPFFFGIRYKNLHPKAAKEHNRSFLKRIANAFSTWELNRIGKKGFIPFGSSCFAVLEKAR